MRKILGLTVAAVLVMGLVGGGTWAFFSDTEQSTGNIFTAGTLDLGLSNTDNSSSTGSTTVTFTATAWAPGESVNGTLYVNNNGSIDMASVNITVSVADFNDGTPVSVDAGGGGDTDNLTKMIYISAATWNSGNVATLVGKTIDELTTTEVDFGSLPANTQYPLFLEWSFNGTATNGCQGDDITVTVDIEGNQ